MSSDVELLGRLGIAATAPVGVPGAPTSADLRQQLLDALDSSKAPENTARSLVLAVSVELDEVRPNAEFALARLDELLAEALATAEGPDAAAALSMRADALRAEIAAAESAKITALESELVAADAALERALDGSDALRSAADGLSEGALAVAAPALLARLKSLVDAVVALPTGAVAEATLLVVPPPALGLPTGDAPRPLLASLVTAHVTLDDVRVVGAAWDGCVCAPGGTIVVAEVSLVGAPADADGSQLRALARRVQAHAHWEESTRAAPGAGCGTPLPVLTTPVVRTDVGNAATGGRVSVSLTIPAASPVGSRLIIASLRVADAPVPGFPAAITLVGPGEPVSLRAPLVLPAPCDTGAAFGVTPCVSPAGLVFIPSGGSAPGLAAFDACGAAVALPAAVLAAAADCATAAAYAPAELVPRSVHAAGLPHEGGGSPLLILGGEAGLQALDAATGARVWASAPGDFASVSGLALMQPAWSGDLRAEPGAIVVATSRHAHKVHTHALSDGSRVSSHRERGPVGLAAEVPASGSRSSGDVFMSSLEDFLHGTVSRLSLSWAGGPRLDERLGSGVRLAGGQHFSDPVLLLATVPGRRGHGGAPPGPAHLVVAPLGRPQLFVFSLPGRELVATVTLGDVRGVTGLAADAAGTALVVCDGASGCAHVLRWPLDAEALARRTRQLPSWCERRDAELRALAAKRAEARAAAGRK